MLFHSPAFLFAFLPISVAGFFLLRRFGFGTGALAWLVVVSLFFYGWWNPAYLWLLGTSIVLNFALGKLLEREGRHRKALLIAGIALNLGALGYFKYFNFFVGSDIAIILPLAISFFTFEQIAWLVESYRREVTHVDWLRYCVFITNFPKLIAGPIVRPHELLPQLEQEQTSVFRIDHISIGLTIFTIGLFKKVVLADSLVPLVGPVFHAAELGQSITFLEAWGAALAYMLQIYFDFSGYTDMGIGAARMFGLQLPLNFDAPYRSLGIIDFWRRWHMSLSRLIRDYVYIPLGGSRKGEVRKHVNLLITMTLCGLWHGAGWTFVLWGALHGAFMVINHGWRATGVRLPRALAWTVTMLAVLIGWVFFRAESVPSALDILASLGGGNGLSLPASLQTHLGSLVAAGVQFDLERALVLTPGEWIRGAKWIAIMAVIVLFFPTTQRFMERWRPTMLTALGVSGLAVTSLVFLLLSRQTEFLYFQF